MFISQVSKSNMKYQLPEVLTNIFKKNDQIHDHNTCLSKHLHKPLSKTNARKFTVANNLTDDIRDSQ